MVQLDLGDDLLDLNTIQEKVITELADSFAKCTPPGGQIRSILHWVHHFLCINMGPSSDELDQASFRNALVERANVHKEESENAGTLSHKDAPGKLQDERKWELHKSAVENMQSTIPGIMDLPLNYIICEEEDQNDKAGYDTFVQQCGACALLTGTRGGCMTSSPVDPFFTSR